MQEEIFPLDPDKVYFSNDDLSLEVDGVMRTLKVGVWINTDPVRIHQMIIRDKVLKVDDFEVFNPLVSKLRRIDPDYYKRIMGLKVLIDFPGYSSGIVAKIPYENDPLGFYKWWRKGKHEEKVFLSRPNMIRLFQKVLSMDSKMILKKDIDFLKS